ncbi:MAG: nucleotidyltransferase family protein [Lachnospiraceae bacterium]
MKITAIIAEYNPFHYGHLYQLTSARRETDADYMIVALSGDFVQRGAPAILDKYARTTMALKAGADLVLELPVYYAAASADYFSMGAVSLLDRLGCVNCLSFGSEHGGIEDLSSIASHTAAETPAYQQSLNRYLKKGMHFALANAKAAGEQFENSDIVEAILKEPNNTLGVAYLKALLRRHSSIVPHTVARRQSGYHTTEKGALSASAVRYAVRNGDVMDTLTTQIPDYVLEELKRAHQKSFPIYENDFSLPLSYRLRALFLEAALHSDEKNAVAGCLTDFADVSPELAFRIVSSLNDYENFEQFSLLLKTKEIIYSRISRALLHILLDIKKSRLEDYVLDGYVPYARILGFRKEAAPLFSIIKANSEIPLIAKLADAQKILGNKNSYHMLLEDIHAAQIYEQVVCAKFGQPFRSEYSREIIRI